MKLKSKIVNFGEFRKSELKVFNIIINTFNKAFDLNLLQYVFSEKIHNYEIRDYHDINEKGQRLLLSLKEELELFSNEYYQSKTCKDVAILINEELKTVIEFANERIITEEGYPIGRVKIYNNEKHDVFDENTQFSRISSFQILRDIQVLRRYQKLYNYSIKSL